MIDVLKFLRNKIFKDNVFIAPNIPAKKLKNALEYIAYDLKSSDEILCLVDDTLFGSNKCGIAISKEAVYFKSDFMKPFRVDLRNIEHCDVQKSDSISAKIFINDEELFTCSCAGFGNVKKVFQAIMDAINDSRSNVETIAKNDIDNNIDESNKTEQQIGDKNSDLPQDLPQQEYNANEPKNKSNESKKRTNIKKIALVAIVLFLLIRLGMWGYKQTQIESQVASDSAEPTVALKDKPSVAQSADKSSESREYFCSGDDFAVCEKYYLDSCNGEDYFSCFTLSTMYGEVLDFANAKKYVQMVCENINANMPFTHTPITQKAIDFSADDLGKLKNQACEGQEVYSALLALNTSCDSGDGKSCHNLGAFYADKKFGDVQRNKQIAITYFGKACDLDIAEGCFNLGLLFASGEGGLQQDYKTALQYYEKACNLNLVNACTNLAMLYAQGRGVQQSRYHIAKYLCKSCNLGHSESCDKFAEVGLGLILDDDCE